MARTESNTTLSLGTIAPDFNLYDTISGNNLSLQQLKSKTATVVLFICNHCPYVLHINAELVALANEYSAKGVSFIAISSNDVVKYPDDAPDKMKERALELHYPFPYLYDESQAVAKAYDAVCTPDIYVFEGNLKLAYHGQLDDSRPNTEIPVTGKDIRHALDCILNNVPNTQLQRPSIGCNIKWKQ